MSRTPAQPEPGPGAGRGVVAPEVAGGPYGAAAQLAVRVDDLRRFSIECQRWLDALAQSARALLADVEALPLPRPGAGVDLDDPAQWAAVAALMSAVGELELLTRVGSQAIEGRLGLLSHHLELAAAVYETGEELNRAALIALDEVVAGGAGMLASTYPDRPVEMSAALRLIDRPAPRGIDDLFALVEGWPDDVIGLAGWKGAPGLAGLTAVPGAVGLVGLTAAAATAGLGTLRASAIRAGVGGEATKAWPELLGAAGPGGVTAAAGATPGSTVGAAADAAADAADGGKASARQREPQWPPPGRLDVWQVDPDRNTYVVAIPGTSSWAPPWSAQDQPDVRNLGVNLELVGHESSAEVEALPQALTQAGVPLGATLILVGHSQGGLTAYAAAGSRAIRDRFRVSHVLTAGSPVAGMPAPAGVRVLSLERRGDLVPRLDGRPNLDRPDHLSVAFHLEQDATDQAREQAGQRLDVQHSLGERVGQQHELAGYRRAGSWVDVATDPGLVEFRASLAEVGVGPGEQARPASVGTRVVLEHPVPGSRPVPDPASVGRPGDLAVGADR